MILVAGAGTLVYDHKRELASFRVEVPATQGATVTETFELPPGAYIVKAIPGSAYSGAADAHLVDYELSVPAVEFETNKQLEIHFRNGVVEYHVQRFSIDSGPAKASLSLKLLSHHSREVEIQLEITEAVLFRTHI